MRVLRCIGRLFGTLPALSCVYAVHVGNICQKWRVDHAVALRLFVVAVVCGICGRDGWPEVVMVLVVLPATDIAALNRLVAELLDGVFCEVAVLLQCSSRRAKSGWVSIAVAHCARLLRRKQSSLAAPLVVRARRSVTQELLRLRVFVLQQD